MHLYKKKREKDKVLTCTKHHIIIQVTSVYFTITEIIGINMYKTLNYYTSDQFIFYYNRDNVLEYNIIQKHAMICIICYFTITYLVQDYLAQDLKTH